MAEPVRVLHFVQKMDLGGVQSMIMNYYRNIDKRKIQFDFIVQSKEEGFFDEEIISLGGVIHYVKPMKDLFHYCRDINRVLKRCDYKIIHTHHNFANIYCLFFSYLNRVPNRISHSHNSYRESSILRRYIKKVIQILINKFSTHKFACSVVAGNWLYGNKKNFLIINNAIETEKFRFNSLTRSKKRQELKVSDRIVIGHIGNFSEQKNHEYLIDIFNEIHKLNNTAHLLLIGQGSLENQIKSKVDRLNLNKHVSFLGKRNDVEDLLQAFDIFLFPSLHEGLPVVIVEAQAAGLKCIISDEITKEVAISNLVVFLGLDEISTHWAQIVLMNLKDKERSDMSDVIKESGYDIIQQSLILENIYISMLTSSMNKN